MDTASSLLIFDPFSGISGDMILGGLIEVGLSEEWLQELVAGLPIEAKLEITKVRRGALSARAVNIIAEEDRSERRLDDVLEVIEAATIDSEARGAAAATFRRIAEVEGAVHGVPADRVHFHEVGAVDALVDVIGAIAGVSELGVGVSQCFTRPVAVGRGWVEAKHGQLPLPAPATMKLLEGMPVVASHLEGELTTPTGAALLATLTEGRSPPGVFLPQRSGYGAGSQDPATHPNCLRLVLATSGEEAGLLLLQADIDDMSPEYVPSLTASLFESGAIDVVTHAVQMKKGRTGLRVEALVPDVRKDEVAAALFRTSTTLGLRFWRVDRRVLPRGVKTLQWRGFTIRLKTSQLPDGHLRWKAEYDDIVRAAKETGLAPLDVQREIEQMVESSREVG